MAMERNLYITEDDTRKTASTKLHSIFPSAIRRLPFFFISLCVSFCIVGCKSLCLIAIKMEIEEIQFLGGFNCAVSISLHHISMFNLNLKCGNIALVDSSFFVFVCVLRFHTFFSILLLLFGLNDSNDFACNWNDTCNTQTVTVFKKIVPWKALSSL